MGVKYLSSVGEIELSATAPRLDTQALAPAEILDLDSSELEGVEAVTPVPSVDGAVGFVPIGLGKPLSIRIHTIYTGEFGRRSRDVLVVSGLKSEQTFDKTGRMINLLEQSRSSREYLKFSAFRNGSPIVYYTPALTDSGLFCSFDITADAFSRDVFDKVANLFQMASGLPVFAPAGAYLMAGAFLTRMFATLANAFRESGPLLSETLTLSFDVGGVPNFKEGLYIVHNLNHAAEFARLVPATRGGSDVLLVDASQRPYQGPAPYLLIGVNGKSEPQLEKLAQQTASAALLEEFYPSESKPNVLINELGEALQLYNDLKFLRKARDAEKRVERLAADDPERAVLEKLVAAYNDNILLEEFRGLGARRS